MILTRAEARIKTMLWNAEHREWLKNEAEKVRACVRAGDGMRACV